MARPSAFSHCFLFVLFWLTYSQQRLILFLFAARRATNGRPFYCWCLTIFFFPFFFFLLYISRKKLSSAGASEEESPNTADTPFCCWTGDEPAPYGGRLAPTELLPAHHQQKRAASLSQPHFLLVFFSLFSILLINSDDDDLVFFLFWNSFTEYRDPLLCSTRRPDSSMSGQFSVEAAASFHEIG